MTPAPDRRPKKRRFKEKSSTSSSERQYEKEQERRAEARRLEEGAARAGVRSRTDPQRGTTQSPQSYVRAHPGEHPPRSSMRRSCVSCSVRSSTSTRNTFARRSGLKTWLTRMSAAAPRKCCWPAIAATADDKLSRFAVRLALSGHVRIPRDDEPDFLTEAESGVHSSAEEGRRVPKTGKPPVALFQAQDQSQEANSSEEADRSLTRSGSRLLAPAHFPEKE